MADQSLPHAAQSELNPLIEGRDTFNNVSDALQFLARIHEERADRLHLAEHDIIAPPDDMNAAEHRGFALLLRVTDAALRYQSAGRTRRPVAGAAPAGDIA